MGVLSPKTVLQGESLYLAAQEGPYFGFWVSTCVFFVKIAVNIISILELMTGHVSRNPNPRGVCCLAEFAVPPTRAGAA